ncbi:MAG TPA: O-antigen ligase family protein, partial [Actinomycetota bacterium]
LLIILGLAILPDLSHRLKMLMIPFLATSGFFLLFTYTRSAWVATVAGLLVVGMCNGRKILGVVGLLVVVVAFTVPGVAARFADLEETSTSSGAAANSLVWRFGYWQQALQLSDSPLIGEGLSTVRASTDVEKEPHNDFIRVYVEMGIVGMAAYLWLLFSFAGVARRGLREVTKGLDRGIVAGFTGAVVAFLLLSLVSNVITQLVILWYFTAIASAAVAAPRLVSAPREVDPPVGATALVRS